MLSYKGYTGHVEYDDTAGIFHGLQKGLSESANLRTAVADGVDGRGRAK